MWIDGLRKADWLDSRRLHAYAVVFAIVSVAIIGIDFRSHLANGVTDDAGDHLGGDFVNIWSGAHLAAQGHAATAYDRVAFTAYQRSLIGPVSISEVYTPPPVMMLLTLPLGWLPYILGLVAWLLLGTVANVLLASRVLGRNLAVLAFVGAPAAVINALSGQMGLATSCLLACGVMLLDRAPIAAGMAFGLLCCKPQMALLVPVALAAGGRWRSFGAAAVTAVVVVAASIAAFGLEPWTEFLRQSAETKAGMEDIASWWHRTPTIFGAARIVGLGVHAAYAVQAVSGVAAALLTILVWRSAAPIALAGAALFLATFLATPYAWDYDMVVLLFAAIFAGRHAADTGWLPYEKITVAGLVMLPYGMIVLGGVAGVPVAPLVLWPALIFVAGRAGALPGWRWRQTEFQRR